MSKTISPEYQAHKSGSAKTITGLLKVGPLRDETFIAVTSGNRSVTYDDGTGDGPLLYLASTGFERTEISSTADLGVDNAEAKTLMPAYPNPGITPAMIDRGELDAIEYVIYEVNYNDLSMGHEIMSSGPIGEQKIHRGGLITIELRSWSQYLKQKSVVQLTSITCRATHGSMPIGTGGGVVEERFPCNYDVSGEWVDVIVTSVGTETVREFTVEHIGAGPPLQAVDDYYAPGLFMCESGDNEGQEREIESYAADGSLSLLITTRNPMQVGDLGRMRRRCTNRWSGHNSCKTYNNNEWFRGEKDIPIGDSLALNVPGVAGGGFSTGTGETAPE